MEESIFKTKVNPLPGARWANVAKKAFRQYNDIKAKSKRRPYVRSVYWNGQKIFLQLFWRHLDEKENLRDKTRRVKFFPCAIDLIQNARVKPEQKPHPEHASQTVYRFTGMTPNNCIFRVQIKEDKEGNKWLISIFPYDR